MADSNLTGDQILNQVFDEENELLKTSAQTNPAGGRTIIEIGNRGTEPTAIYNLVLKDSPAPTLDTTGITAEKDATNDLGYIITLTSVQTDDGWIRTPDGIRPVVNQETHDLYKADVRVHYDNIDNPLLTSFSAVYEENLRGVKGDKGAGLLHLHLTLKIYKTGYRGLNSGVSDVPQNPTFAANAVTYNVTNGNINVVIPTSGGGASIPRNEGWVFVKSESDIPRTFQDGSTLRSGNSIDVFVVDVRTTLDTQTASGNLVTAATVDIGEPYLYDATNAINFVSSELETEVTERNLEIADIVTGSAHRDIGGGRTEPVGTAPDGRSLTELGARLDVVEARPSGGGLSETFIRSTIVEPAVNIHNADEDAHKTIIDPIKTRVELLEARPKRGLRVIAINDGLPVFDSRDSLPDTMTLTVQTDTDIHGPISIRLRGQETQAGISVIIGTRGDTAISEGAVERVTFQLASAQKGLIETVAQGRNGTADISIYGALESGGTATHQATFAIFIKNSIASFIGPTNRNEILVNGLPSLLPTIIQTVLANLTAEHRPVQLFGGIGNSSVTRADNVQISQTLFDEYKKAEWLYIYIGPSVINVALTDINADGSDHFRVPLEAMNRSTGEVYYRHHFQRQGNLNNAYINIQVGSDRRISVTTNNLGNIGPDFLSVVAYVPTYSYTLPDGTTVAGLTPP